MLDLKDDGNNLLKQSQVPGRLPGAKWRSQECPCVTLTGNQIWLEWRFALPSGESCLTLTSELLKGMSSSASTVNWAQLASPDSRATADILPGSDEPVGMAGVGYQLSSEGPAHRGRHQPKTGGPGLCEEAGWTWACEKCALSSICPRCLIYFLGSE